MDYTDYTKLRPGIKGCQWLSRSTNKKTGTAQMARNEGDKSAQGKHQKAEP
jgi:hypothetical protein